MSNFRSPSRSVFSIINMCSSQRYLPSNGRILQRSDSLSLSLYTHIRARAADCGGFIKICSMAATSSSNSIECALQQYTMLWGDRRAVVDITFLVFESKPITIPIPVIIMWRISFNYYMEQLCDVHALE